MSLLSLKQPSHHNHLGAPTLDNKENKLNTASAPKGILKQSSISKTIPSTTKLVPSNSNINSNNIQQSLFYQNQTTSFPQTPAFSSPPYLQQLSSNQNILSHIDTLLATREQPQFSSKDATIPVSFDLQNYSSQHYFPSTTPSSQYSTFQSTILENNFQSLRSLKSKNGQPTKRAGDLKSYLESLEEKAHKKDNSAALSSSRVDSSFSRSKTGKISNRSQQQQQRIPAGRGSMLSNPAPRSQFPIANYNSGQQAKSFHQITEMYESDTDSSSSSSSSESSPLKDQTSRRTSALSQGIATSSRFKRAISANTQLPFNKKHTNQQDNIFPIQSKQLEEGKQYKPYQLNNKNPQNQQYPSRTSGFQHTQTKQHYSPTIDQQHRNEQYAMQPQIVTAAATRSFASEQIFCIMCEDYIEADKVDDHSVYCQENQLAITRRIAAKGDAIPAETRYQIEKLNQKILKIKIHLEDIQIEESIVQSKRIYQYQMYLILVATKVLVTNSDLPTTHLTDLRIIAKKLEDLENLSNRFIVYSLLVLLDKLAKFTKDKINYVHLEQISDSRYVAQPARNDDQRYESETQHDTFTEPSQIGRARALNLKNRNQTESHSISVKSIPFQLSSQQQNQQQQQIIQPESSPRLANHNPNQDRVRNQSFFSRSNANPQIQNIREYNSNPAFYQPDQSNNQQPKNYHTQQMVQLNQQQPSFETSEAATKRAFFVHAVRLKQTYPSSVEVQGVLIANLFAIFMQQQQQGQQQPTQTTIESYLEEYFNELGKKKVR